MGAGVVESFHGSVESLYDALLLVEASRLGHIPRLATRLPAATARHHTQPGVVYVYSERESGIRRWTDGRSWGSGTLQGVFLVYREVGGRKRKHGWGRGRKSGRRRRKKKGREGRYGEGSAGEVRWGEEGGEDEEDEDEEVLVVVEEEEKEDEEEEEKGWLVRRAVSVDTASEGRFHVVAYSRTCPYCSSILPSPLCPAATTTTAGGSNSSTYPSPCSPSSCEYASILNLPGKHHHHLHHLYHQHQLEHTLRTPSQVWGGRRALVLRPEVYPVLGRYIRCDERGGGASAASGSVVSTTRKHTDAYGGDGQGRGDGDGKRRLRKVNTGVAEASQAERGPVAGPSAVPPAPPRAEAPLALLPSAPPPPPPTVHAAPPIRIPLPTPPCISHQRHHHHHHAGTIPTPLPHSRARHTTLPHLRTLIGDILHRHPPRHPNPSIPSLNGTKT